MARYVCQGHFRDKFGHIIPSATVSVFLAGTTTVASVYAAVSGGAAVNSVTSDSSSGLFAFFIDDGDYAATQRYKVSMAKSGFQTITYDYVVIPRSV